MSKTLSISKARESFGTLIGNVSRRKTRCVITHKGSPKAVLISLAEFESWKATLEVLTNRDEYEGVQQGLDELNSGQFFLFEEVFGEPSNGKKTEADQTIPDCVKNNC